MPSKVRLDFVFWHKLIFGHFLATGPASLTKLLEIHALNFDQLNLSSFACQFNISVKSKTNFISRPHFWLCQNFPSDYNFTTVLRFQKTKKKVIFWNFFRNSHDQKYQMSEHVLNINFSKKITKLQRRKNSSKCVYISATQCRAHFNLTNFFDKLFQNSNFAQILESHSNLSIKTCWDILLINFWRKNRIES